MFHDPSKGRARIRHTYSHRCDNCNSEKFYEPEDIERYQHAVDLTIWQAISPANTETPVWSVFQMEIHFLKNGTIKLPGVFGTIKLPRVRLKNSG